VHKRVIGHWTHSQLSSLLTTHDIDRSDVRAICIRELDSDFETRRLRYTQLESVNALAALFKTAPRNVDAAMRIGAKSEALFRGAVSFSLISRNNKRIIGESSESSGERLARARGVRDKRRIKAPL